MGRIPGLAVQDDRGRNKNRSMAPDLADFDFATRLLNFIKEFIRTVGVVLGCPSMRSTVDMNVTRKYIRTA